LKTVAQQEEEQQRRQQDEQRYDQFLIQKSLPNIRTDLLWNIVNSKSIRMFHDLF